MKNYISTFWHKTRGAVILASIGGFFWVLALYQQVAKQFQYTTPYGQQTTYTAGGFHQFCQSINNGVYSGDPTTASSACASAATDEAAKGHAFVLGLVLLMIAAYWANKRLHLWGPKAKNAPADPEYQHGMPKHVNCDDSCPDDKPERDC